MPFQGISMGCWTAANISIYTIHKVPVYSCSESNMYICRDDMHDLVVETCLAMQSLYTVLPRLSSSSPSCVSLLCAKKETHS